MNLPQYARKVYSQFGEDGCTLELVRRLNPPKTFLEIGAGHNGENNTHVLLDHGWDGLWIDPRVMEIGLEVRQNPGLMLLARRLTINNVLSLRYLVPHKLGVLSLDVDGNDYWLWKALCAEFAPAICIVECNMHPPGGDPWYIAPYRPEYAWDQQSRDHGAGLSAMLNLGITLGYRFVGMASATPELDSPNAFFVREEFVERL